MPDSHLISDKEFVDLVTNDRSCFKFVKYFTPHCPYCRYLKVVFDTLKHQKEWCFNIYELNCQWYPQFCMSNVKSTSFPYTVIYDQNGNVFEEIHGFYPENIISAIFSRIEDECLKVKNPSGGQQNQPVQSQNVQSSLSA
jgi:thioredoxin-related protein